MPWGAKATFRGVKPERTQRTRLPVEFCRPVAEFLDGRFVEVAS